MGFEMSSENLSDEPSIEDKPALVEARELNIESKEKERKIRKIEELMKRFVATGVVVLTLGGVTEIAGRVMGIKPEGIKVKLEKVEDIKYKDGVLGAEEIRAFLDTMPANWAYGEISAIQGVGKSYKDSQKFNTRAEYNTIDLTISLDESDAVNESRLQIFDDLSHEIGHANDFSSDNDLSSEDRNKLEEDIKQRIQAPDRLESPYIEDLIEAKTSQRNLVEEYWAEICRAYIMDPHSMSVDDFKLVDEYVKKNDSSYKWKDSIQKRMDLVYAK